MAYGCRIIEPNGKVCVIKAETREQIPERVQAVLEKWEKYCDQNWLNESGDVYAPALKAKRLLDSLAYFLLSGNTQGIETDYKHVMHSKREIPVSSCPSNIENMLYSTEVPGPNARREENAEFETLLQRLDARAEPYIQQRARRAKPPESRFHRHERKGIHGGEWCVVDTERVFKIGDRYFRIDDGETQYDPILTKYGELYDMDRVLAYDGKFYDMDFHEIHVTPVEGT